ncbi:hypothetical protein CN563_05010 [Bacillus sp. AFS026049]|nr:hypothetical protein CON84_15565 [Bacillus sp. AFS094228]PEO49578.1 hypothetical protein CN563_05010 [Bacillus sp. AFS026049]
MKNLATEILKGLLEERSEIEYINRFFVKNSTYNIKKVIIPSSSIYPHNKTEQTFAFHLHIKRMFAYNDSKQVSKGVTRNEIYTS